MRITELPKTLYTIFLFIDLFDREFRNPIKNQKMMISKSEKKLLKDLFYYYEINRHMLWTDFMKLVERQVIEFGRSPMSTATTLIKSLKKEGK